MRPGRLCKAEYDALKLLVLARDKGKCRVCKTRQGLAPHHIVYRSAGGLDTSANLLTLCVTCHDMVHACKLFILPLTEGEEIDADKGVRIKFK